MVNKYFYRFGGTEVYLFSVSDLLRSHGHTVIPFAMNHQRNEESPYSRFFVDNVDYGTGNGTGGAAKTKAALSSIYSFEARRKIGMLLQETKPDLVHLHNYNYQITPSVLYEAAARGVPIVQTLHDPQIICPHHRLYNYDTMRVCEKCKGLHFYHAVTTRCIQGSLLKSAVGAVESYLYHTLRTYQKHVRLFISPSRFLQKKINDFGLHDIRVEYLPHFVDVASPGGTSTNSGYCLYFGRLSHEKGVMTLLESMKLLEEGELWIAGDGPLRNTLESRVKSEGMAGRVKVLGYKNRREIASLLANCSFTVVPSEWPDNAPFSVMESFAAGKAVVGSNRGGIPEMIGSNERGLVFEAGNVAELSSALSTMFSSRSLRDRLGKAARSFAESNYSGERHFEDLMRLYKDVIA